jgi:hypothetical protein
MSEECCNHNCNQGRDCPLRKTEKQSKFDGNNKVNELAKELSEFMTEDGYTELDKTIFKATTMLRQQEAELTEAGGMIGVLREYISDLENGLDSSIKLNKAQAERQVKELTDGEITEVATINLGHSMGLLNWMGFARAILRKAQENG